MGSTPSYYNYWGKAEKDGDRYHLLPYHCLDVAAVGKVLLGNNPSLLKRLSQLSGVDAAILKPVLLFFLALHDLGKFSETFQSVRPDLREELQGKAKSQKQPYSRKNFGHDSIGFLLWKGLIFTKVIRKTIEHEKLGNEVDWWDVFKWLMEASNGHHGLPVKQ